MGYIDAIRYVADPPRGSYLWDLPVVRSLQELKTLRLSAPVTFLIGENGTGKSTLLEAIAVCAGFNAEGGGRNFHFSTRATHSELHKSLSLTRRKFPKDGFFLRAESFYNVASNIDDLDREGFGPRLLDSYGGKSLHAQSHGESFLALVQHRFGGRGLYILDEPEAALSPMRLMTLLTLMHELVKQDSQFIISTHSPILMAYPGAEIFQLGAEGIRQVAYKDTEHYRMSLRFLQDPESMLRMLLEE